MDDDDHSQQGVVPEANPADAMAAAFAAALAPMTAALQNLALAPPPAPAVPAPSSGASVPFIHLPANTIKLPIFKGTMPDPRSHDKNSEVSASPALVTSTLQRMDAFFDSYAHSFPTEQLKLSALISCFPPGSPAAAWYESDDGMQSFASYADFKVAFESHFGPTEIDKQRYDEQLKTFSQKETESVVAYYTRFKQLCAELKAVGKPVQLHWQKTPFVLGLKDKLKREVSRTFGRNSSLSLEQLYSEAEMEESLLKPVNRPIVRGIKGNQRQPRRKCFFCRSIEHLGKDCPKIAAKKRDGTWQDKPSRQGGAAQ
jgi:hypothetical protein